MREREREMRDWDSNHRAVQQSTQYNMMVGSKPWYGPDPLSDSVRRSDQLLRGTSGADQSTQRKRDFTGPLHWSPIATDGIVGLRLKVDWGLSTVTMTYSPTWTLCRFNVCPNTLNANDVFPWSLITNRSTKETVDFIHGVLKQRLVWHWIS